MSLKKPKQDTAPVEEVAEEKVVGKAAEDSPAEVEAESTVDTNVKPAAEAEAEPAASQAVATRPETGTAVAARSNTGGGHLVDQLADEGFEGLEAGYFSFTSIKLDKGDFVTSDGDDLAEDAFNVVLMESKARWAYAESKEDDADCYFSYDQVHTTSGEELAPILAEWKAEDKGLPPKKYVDLTVQVVSGTLADQVAILQISPASVQKLTGYMGLLRYKGLNPREVLTTVKVGKKITNRNKDTYYPWAFDLASK